MRHTKGHTGNRRSHHGLKEPRLSTCSNCNHKHIRHQMCENCGQYRGREVVDVTAIKERKRARKEAKERAIGEVTGKEPVKADESDLETDAATPEQDAPLSAEELSKK